MQFMFMLGLEHALTNLDTTAPDGLTRMGLQDHMTFIGSVAPLNIDRTLAEVRLSAGQTNHV